MKDASAVRAEIHAARHAGLDPDLPPLLHRLAMVSSLWSFSADDAREYPTAQAAGGWRALRDLLRRNRAFVTRGQRKRLAPTSPATRLLRARLFRRN